MYKIMFSLLVHEEPDVIIDQMVNLNHFVQDSAVVLHINPKFDFEKFNYTFEEFKEKITSFGNVFINENRLGVGKDNIIQAHVSNFSFVENVDFEYFYFIASNELFIKEGLYQHIKNYEYGCENLIKEDWHYFELMKNDTDLGRMMKENNIQCHSYSQIEGSFYKKELFQRINSIIIEYYDYKHPIGKYPRDEVYFSTLANGLFINMKHYNGCCCKIRWEGKILFTSIGSIKRILKKEETPLFSVKRVDRVLNNYLRSYIRKHIGHYSLETKSYTKKKIKESSKIKILFLNIFYLVKFFIRNIMAKLYRFIFRKK